MFCNGVWRIIYLTVYGIFYIISSIMIVVVILQIVNDRELSTTSYNLTECCVNIKLRPMCMPLCSFDANMTDIRALAPFCNAELHKLIKCGSGGRNHGVCCTRRGVPGLCTPLCSGIIPNTPLSATLSCATFIGNVVQCFEEGNVTFTSFRIIYAYNII